MTTINVQLVWHNNAIAKTKLNKNHGTLKTLITLFIFTICFGRFCI